MTVPSDRKERDALYARLAPRFGVPDGGRYANDWLDRLDEVLAVVERYENALRTLEQKASQYFDTGRGDLDGAIMAARAALAGTEASR